MIVGGKETGSCEVLCHWCYGFRERVDLCMNGRRDIGSTVLSSAWKYSDAVTCPETIRVVSTDNFDS